MKHSYLTALLLVLFLPLADVHAQLSLNIFHKKTRVKLTPANKSYRLEDEEIALQEGFFNEQERWMVFSDRAANYTYKKPGSEVQLKALPFMEPCYVIGKSGDYMELVRYDPKLIKQGAKGKIDRKSADYLGWIHSSRLLLWRTALKENTTKFYIKALTGFKNEQLFSALPRYVSGDSLLLYSGPSLKDIAGKCGLENLFYIFKQSDDGRQYLLGRTAQFTVDSRATAICGWVSKDVVKLWGTRLYLTAGNANGSSSKQPLSFYADSSVAINAVAGAKPFYYADSDMASPNPVENIYPVQSIKDLTDSSSLIKTAILADVLDRSQNEVINVLGNKIRFADFLHIIKSQHKTNIVFVMDGGRENSRYLPNVLTILQNLEMLFDTSRTFRDFNYGAVVYKDNLAGSCRTSTLPLTGKYGEVVKYFYERQQEVAACNNDTIAQAMFSGMMEATRLLAAHKDENNIILLIGAAGNNMDGSITYADVISRLSYVRARMLVFQTHSIPHPSYNDFVIQTKNLVLKSALNISELKKEKLVDLNDVLSNPSFSLAKGDSGVYFLDFPARSMTQGYVLFPGKGEIMQPFFLERQLDSLMQKLYMDNERVEASLYRFFNTIGIRNTRILDPYRFYYTSVDTGYLPLSFLKAVPFRGRPFTISGWVIYKDNLQDSLNNVTFGVLLSVDEYEQMIRALFDLGGERDYTNESRRRIYRHLHGVVNSYLNRKNIEVDERISRLSLAEVLEWLTGYKSVNPLWNITELRMIKSAGKSKKEALLFLAQCKKTALWMQQNANSMSHRFFNNGQAYYLLDNKSLF